MGIHAIKDYARRVPNKAVGLADNEIRYITSQKNRGALQAHLE